MSSNNLPILEKIINIPSGGDSTFKASIWFVSKLEKRNMLWGGGGLRIVDPYFQVPIKLSARGQYGIRIKDGGLLLLKFVGTQAIFTTEDILDQFRIDVLESVKVSISRYMKEKGILFKNTAVVTAGSTLGFRRYASDHGIKLVSSGAGTRYVLERMLEGGYKLGGEPDGHIIFLDDSGTGDGQLAGVRLLSIMKEKGSPLSGLSGDMPRYPQVRLNVKIHPHYKELWKNEKDITELIDSFGKELGDEGRLVIRESGKEPIVRILIEGADFGRINDMAVEIAQTIKDTCAYKV